MPEHPVLGPYFRSRIGNKLWNNGSKWESYQTGKIDRKVGTETHPFPKKTGNSCNQYKRDDAFRLAFRTGSTQGSVWIWLVCEMWLTG